MGNMGTGKESKMAGRRTATVEQKTKAKERRRMMAQLAQRVSKMSEAERVQLVGDGWPVTIEGHRLSMHNACMLACQRQGVSVVGGFRQWRRASRSVCKGEHGQAIWVPLSKPESKPGEDAESEEETEEPQRPRFMLATVFDISQTKALDA